MLQKKKKQSRRIRKGKNCRIRNEKGLEIIFESFFIKITQLNAITLPTIKDKRKVISKYTKNYPQF